MGVISEGLGKPKKLWEEGGSHSEGPLLKPTYRRGFGFRVQGPNPNHIGRR